MPRVYLMAATANAWVLILVLVLAFVVQFMSGELPCPLCVMQRVGLMLCALAPLYLLISQRDGEVMVRDVAVAGGIGVVAGLVGAAASARQIMLRILPNDPGFGHAVFGLHLYTWCLIAFLAQIAASGLMLVGLVWLPKSRLQPWPLTGMTAAALTVVVAANIVSVIAEAGFNWLLPENPIQYLLFK